LVLLEGVGELVAFRFDMSRVAGWAWKEILYIYLILRKTLKRARLDLYHLHKQ
jgi:hypothetical protein